MPTYPNYQNRTEALQGFRDCARAFRLKDTWQVTVEEDEVVGFIWVANNGAFHLREVLPRDETKHEDIRYVAYLGGPGYKCRDTFFSQGPTPFDALLGTRLALDLVMDQASHFHRLLGV